MDFPAPALGFYAFIPFAVTGLVIFVWKRRRAQNG